TAGASCTGAVARVFAAAGFLGGAGAAVSGGGAIDCAFEASGAARAADEAPVNGSGVMMLTGGIEAALGKSALVGLPVAPGDGAGGAGVGGCRAATAATGAPHAAS